MKTYFWQKAFSTLAIAGVTAATPTAWADLQPAINPPAATTPATPLAYGVPQILQLTQAKISDDTIIAYIKSAGISYGLDASQIIYLRQQGVSDPIITTMLSQGRPATSYVAEMTPPPPAPTPAPAQAPAPAPTTTSTVTYIPSAPTVTYVETAPAVTYYAGYPYYYGPAYGYCYPPVTLSFGFGWHSGYYRGGYGYYRGGYRGGWHR